MALVRDSDTSLWLHNKLGTSNDLWSGSSICSQLNQDVLRNIRECFIDLQSQVKLKLLLSFMHIQRRNVEEWKTELEDILEVASADSDQWVSMLAELLKTYPGTGMLNFQVEENSTVFTDLVADLKKLVRKHSDQGILPMECLYLNRNALNAIVGQLPPPSKHFALKQKPKSAALRAELLQKSSDAALNSKKTSKATSVPIRCRGLTKSLNDTTPLKGIPSRVLSSGFKSPPSGMNRLGTTPPLSRSLARPPAGRKDGGIKLLDINEQPIGYGREAKRRKKLTEPEVQEQQKKEREIAFPASGSPSITPDYAAGLLSSSSQLSAMIPPSPGASSYAPPTPSTPLPAAAGGTTTVPITVLATPAVQTRENLQPTLQTPSNQVSVVTATTEAVMETIPITVSAVGTSVIGRAATIGSLASMGGATVQVQHLAVQQLQPVHQGIQQPQQVHQQVQTQMPPQKKGLSLSREQILQAQEMFKNSNRVTRPEKALILGFMAGSRENPCPHLGNIVTIKLSENEESVVQPEGITRLMVAETHFQMNYSTGEWKQVKKFRKIDE